MKKIFVLALFALLASGCTEIRLANGKYTTNLSGRDDFAAVYNDLIFLRLRNAEDHTMNNGYWDWAGKYKVVDGRIIDLQMDRKTKRDWQFYYSLTMRGNAIVVEDHRAEHSYVLTHRPALPRRPAAMQQEMPPADVFPAYK